MRRQIESEWLDSLPADDPGAIGSRRDLQRLNLWMGNARLLAHALNSAGPQPAGVPLVELGAGDGRFMAEVVRRLKTKLTWSALVLVDRQRLVPLEVCAAIEKVGGSLTVITADVFDWLGNLQSEAGHTLVCNLFLHHFQDPDLRRLFALAAGRSQAFVALEPRRSAFALGCSHLVGLIGCNHVTRHDAPASVRAGFREAELSRLWPAGAEWILEEREAGLFSHVFMAKRKR
jgi:hypothetical protein